MTKKGEIRISFQREGTCGDGWQYPTIMQVILSWLKLPGIAKGCPSFHTVQVGVDMGERNQSEHTASSEQCSGQLWMQSLDFKQWGGHCLSLK